METDREKKEIINSKLEIDKEENKTYIQNKY